MTPTTRAAVSMLVSIVLAASAGSRPAAVQDPSATPQAAWELLEHASRLRSRLSGLEGAALFRAREELLSTLRSVRQRYPSHKLVAAQAAFRAGELLRAWNEPKAAQAEFEQARELGRGTEFEARSALELAHLQRRLGRLEQALAGYTSVLALHGAAPGVVDTARLWLGRVQLDLGRRGEARSTFAELAQAARSPQVRIDAYDELALEAIGRGDLEGAAGIVDLCLRQLHAQSLEDSQLGRDVGTALDRMRCVHALQLAVRERSRRVRVAK